MVNVLVCCFPAPSLSLDDLSDVLEETLASSAKWYKIGIRLKVPVDKLDDIRSQFSEPGDQLCEMLKEWLKGAVGSRPTWGALVEALRSQTVREPKLADQLEVKHCQSESKSLSKHLQLYILNCPVLNVKQCEKRVAAQYKN